ncbi:anti-sigma factor [Pedobacter sp. KBW06]|uniref:FecR family protein n=1 Tax=Pedobacter sp. KBW06 TaxID=2153359 RepID=UPI000F5AD968|nr:FecR family protein [Pedobacter sp. KBW06]RQO74474.1 anti-sigma factor [Pedobacter sp. KBW06]
MGRKNIKSVLERISSGNFSPEDEIIAKYWIHQLHPNRQSGYSQEDIKRVGTEMWEVITQKTQTSTVKKISLWPRIAVAAAIIAILSITALFFYNHVKEPVSQITMENDFGPGKAGATLTLANGRKITLRDASMGELAEEDGVVISKSADGQVAYELKKTGIGMSGTNILSTARGETYKLILPDGSSVWLNAASSIQYPANFNSADKRIVQLKGEAYFEIAKDRKHPFIVKSFGREIEVLGTHFNINAYSDESNIKTSLLEGSILISQKNKRQLLKPGEQAILSEDEIAVRTVNVDEAVSWKDGYFEFQAADIQTVMRQISRWYNVEVHYERPISKETFTGRISRTKNISQILEMLEASKAVHISIKGRRIMVN